MNKFRKKPVVIEAMRVAADNANIKEVLIWIHGVEWAGNAGISPSDGELFIYTLEGAMTAEPGDWVIRGIKNEFYPCKPDIFAATYEPVETSQ